MKPTCVAVQNPSQLKGQALILPAQKQSFDPSLLKNKALILPAKKKALIPSY